MTIKLFIALLNKLNYISSIYQNFVRRKCGKLIRTILMQLPRGQLTKETFDLNKARKQRAEFPTVYTNVPNLLTHGFEQRCICRYLLQGNQNFHYVTCI